MTAEAARRAFLDWLVQERRASKLTAEAYGTDLADFLGFLTHHLGGEPDLPALATLRQADVRAWLARLAEDGAVNATRARHLSAVRSFFRYLARRHDLDNPAVRLVARRAPPPRPTCSSPQGCPRRGGGIGELSDRAAIQARDTALFTLLYGCGLRIAEALALDVRDAPLPGTDAMLRVTGKGSKQRIVPVLPAVRETIAAWLALHPDRQPEHAAVPGRPRQAAGPGGGAAHHARIPPATACRTTPRRTRCGTPSPPTCWPAAPTCAPSRTCSGHASLSTTQRYTAVDQAQLLEVWRKTHPRG